MSKRPRTRAALRAQQTAGEPDLQSELSFPHSPLHVTLNADVADDKEKLDTDDNMSSKYDKGLKGDYRNLAVLTFLYVLQGIPLGLAGAIPYLLQSRKVSYQDQALYSFVYWPFSVKLLWAPIVDSVYFSWFGRRKTWLVPVQYILGFSMLLLSMHVTELLGEGKGAGPVRIHTLTAVFFMINFLAATQDIAVDGWALTMLARRNVGWASTSNTVGQTTGFFLGYVVFLGLESANICNTYLRSEPKPVGIVTLSDFLYFWGIVFLITTTLVWILKRETSESEPEENKGIVGTYLLLWKIIRLRPVLQLVFILLTCKISFAIADSVSGLKLIEEGVPRDRLALLGIPMVPIQIILPLIISRYTAGPRPMDVFIKAYPFRVLLTLLFPMIVYIAPLMRTGPGEYPMKFYMIVLAVYATYQIALYSMFVAIMGFHARVSDPAIGGTYMTLLNTMSNLGGNWPGTVALWLVDPLSNKVCEGATGTCIGKEAADACVKAGGTCHTIWDGYYIEVVICFVMGVSWWLWGRKRVKRLQDRPESDWTCTQT